MKQRQKRYQRRTKNGVEWTPWFNVSSNHVEEAVQMKGFKGDNLLNEYRTIEVQ